ncbi:unnamed protein product [Camellia sinensis]
MPRVIPSVSLEMLHCRLWVTRRNSSRGNNRQLFNSSLETPLIQTTPMELRAIEFSCESTAILTHPIPSSKEMKMANSPITIPIQCSLTLRTIVMMKMTAEICQSRFASRRRARRRCCRIMEIKNIGGGLAYYHNNKAKLDQLPLDVKAYDAWRVEIPGVNDDMNEKSIYNVASRTVGVRIQKADFLNLVENSAVNRKAVDVVDFVDAEVRNLLPNAGSTAEKPRALHLLDELFDMTPLIQKLHRWTFGKFRESRQQFLLRQTFFEGDEDGQFADNDPNSMFADAPDDCDDEDDGGILELGFPDDGYNYLIHLREIKNTGGGSAYYHNSKAKLDQLPLDVKAYDALRVEILGVNDDSNKKSIYNVASRTVGVRIQKAVDPEVVALLDDSDLSRFGSNDDLEEDFVVKANLLNEAEDVEFDKKLNLVENSAVNRKGVDVVDFVDAEVRNLCTELLVPAMDNKQIEAAIMGAAASIIAVGGRLYRSNETIHRYFRAVLRAILSLYKYMVKLSDNETPLEIWNHNRIVSEVSWPKIWNTTKYLSCHYLRLEIHICISWLGSAHDSHVLNDALTRSGGFKIPEGKYYLGDAGYGIRKGIISSYRGVRYHLKEFSGHQPQNEEELFNLRHSS